MQLYAIFLRGINVGGKNKVPMIQLKTCLEALGFTNVSTYIASGNVILKSSEPAKKIENLIEETLPKKFKLDSSLIKIRALTQKELQDVVDKKPKDFGEQPDIYLSDAIFLMDLDVKEALTVFRPREGVDTIWSGDGVIYSQRLIAQRVSSRLNVIVGTAEYKYMTIRNWNTVVKLLEKMNEVE